MQQEQKIDWKDKNVGIFGGCYCPPHKGHYESIVNAIQTLKLNIVIIEIYGKKDETDSRHGISNSVSLKIWNEWGLVIQKNYRCMVLPFTSNITTKTPSIINRDVDRIYDIEIYDTDKAASAAKKQVQPYSSNFCEGVPRENIEKCILIRDTESGLSATAFTKKLKNVQIALNECLKHIPKVIPYDQQIYYILQLLASDFSLSKFSFKENLEKVKNSLNECLEYIPQDLEYHQQIDYILQLAAYELW